MNPRPHHPALAGQRAFTELLATPLVTAQNHPALHREVTRNADAVATAARRLGYRLASVNRAVRLVRTPAAGTVTAPPPPLEAPTRRLLALVCVLAAACEEAGSTPTLAKLSDLVADLTSPATSPVTPYDPAVLAHRRQLVRAAKELERWGVLYRRTRDDSLLETWAGDGSGIGAGYVIDRDALLLLTTPETIATALDATPADPDELAATRPLRNLRALVELPAVLYADLDPEDQIALRTQRGLRAQDAATITGGHVEARAEGLVLILPEDPLAAATVDWPRAHTASWVALLAADSAGREGTRHPDGTVHLNDRQASDVCEDLRTWQQQYLSKDLREDTARVRAVAEQYLTYLGLLRVLPDRSWVLSPVAGRYRDPVINPTAPAQEQP